MKSMHCGQPKQWSCVMFFYKSRFSLQSDSRRTLIRRAPGTCYHQENTIERHRYDGAGWLVWGGIILGSRTDLHVQSVTMTGHIYRDVILEQHVRLFRGAMGAEFLFMDDNARPHHANIADECLQSEDISRMEWPAYSPDFNPIEHVGDMLGRRIAARQPPPTCLPELQRALLDDLCNVPQDQIEKKSNDNRKSVDTRKYPPSENRVWSDKEDHEESGSQDHAASTCGPHSDSFNNTSRRRRSNCSTNSFQTPAEANLKPKRPFRELLLTPEHRQLRLQWCQARSMWNVTDWQKVVFSDDSRFVLGTDDNRVRVWRHPGELYNSPHNVLSHCMHSWCNGLGGHSL
ncbi:transposable element Tcb1 transposase [Trichonephila clavipes]|nr:transposable element Tcb1 transposase [Trichonephila clavipes]